MPVVSYSMSVRKLWVNGVGKKNSIQEKNLGGVTGKFSRKKKVREVTGSG